MTLFELEASLGFDITEFETNATTAESKAKSLEGSLDALSFPDLTSGNLATLDAEIAALDDEIKALNDEIASLELDLEIDDLDNEIDDLDKSIQRAEMRTSIFSGIIEGVAEGAADFVGDMLGKAFESAGDSIKMAAESASDIAKKYQEDMSRFDVTVGLIQEHLGQTLLTTLADSMNFFENTNNILSAIFGITGTDRLNAALKQISDYEFSNLEQARQSLNDIFDFGSTVDLTPMEMTFEEAIEAYDSQRLYWEEYNRIITNLYSRGVSTDTISPHLSGSESDMAMLMWLNSLTDAQIAELENAQNMVEEAEAATAQTITGFRLSLDEEYRAMMEEADRLDLEANKELTALANDPNASAAHYTASGSYAGGGGSRFDEAVTGLQTSVDALPGAIASALSGAEVTMDGEAVGSIVFPYLSSEFRRIAIGTKYTPGP